MRIDAEGGEVGNRRVGNRKGTTSYVNAVRRDGHAREWEEEPSPEKRLAETWWLGLRLREGVDPGEARRAAGFAASGDPALAVAHEMAASELIEERAGRFRLTDRGLPLADWVARRFLERASI